MVTQWQAEICNLLHDGSAVQRTTNDPWSQLPVQQRQLRQLGYPYEPSVLRQASKLSGSTTEMLGGRPYSADSTEQHSGGGGCQEISKVWPLSTNSCNIPCLS